MKQKNPITLDTQEQLDALEKVRKRLILDLSEPNLLLTLPADELVHDTDLNKWQIMELLNIHTTTYFSKICEKTGIAHGNCVSYSRAQYRTLIRHHTTMDALLSLPDDKLTELQRRIKEVWNKQ